MYARKSHVALTEAPFGRTTTSASSAEAVPGRTRRSAMVVDASIAASSCVCNGRWQAALQGLLASVRAPEQTEAKLLS